MNFIIVDKLSRVTKEHRKSLVAWFLYHFCIAVLCITNTVFLIYNWSDLELNFSDMTNVLLTITGFLFAFAGINIYSIFNTNIEAEKQRLEEIREEYACKMKNEMSYLKFSSDIQKLQMYCQLIFSTGENNSQVLEWVEQARHTITDIATYLEESGSHDDLNTHNQKKNDVMAVCRGIGYHADQFLRRINQPNSRYFSQIDARNAGNIKAQIAFLRTQLYDLSGIDDSDDQSERLNNRSENFLKRCCRRFLTFLLNCID